MDLVWLLTLGLYVTSSASSLYSASSDSTCSSGCSLLKLKRKGACSVLMLQLWVAPYTMPRDTIMPLLPTCTCGLCL